LTAALFDDLDLTGQGDPARVHCAYVTGGFFKTLGGALIFGRSFNEVEDGPSGSSVVLLSERLWRDRFQADPQSIGKNLTLTGRSFQVIGVTPVQNDELSPIDMCKAFFDSLQAKLKINLEVFLERNLLAWLEP
jgi:MacB-like periplasmic core domain